MEREKGGEGETRGKETKGEKRIKREGNIKGEKRGKGREREREHTSKLDQPTQHPTPDTQGN